MTPGSSVFEEQRGRMPQIEQHYGIGYADHRNVGARFGDDRRGIGEDFLVRLLGREDRISGLLLARRVVGLLVPVLEPALVAPELLLDLVRGLLERLVRVLRLA